MDYKIKINSQVKYKSIIFNESQIIYTFGTKNIFLV